MGIPDRLKKLEDAAAAGCPECRGRTATRVEYDPPGAVAAGHAAAPAACPACGRELGVLTIRVVYIDGLSGPFESAAELSRRIDVAESAEAAAPEESR